MITLRNQSPRQAPAANIQSSIGPFVNPLGTPRLPLQKISEIEKKKKKKRGTRTMFSSHPKDKFHWRWIFLEDSFCGTKGHFPRASRVFRACTQRAATQKPLPIPRLLGCSLPVGNITRQTLVISRTEAALERSISPFLTIYHLLYYLSALISPGFFFHHMKESYLVLGSIHVSVYNKIP